MAQIIALIVLILSALGLGVMVWRKIPVLAELPDVPEGSREGLWLRLKNKIFNLSFIKNFNFLAFLQKILSKFRILTLKAESKTADWLQKLRQKTQKQDNFKNDNYWQELKNSTNNKANKKNKPV